jgi:hypothetical protein
MDTSTRVFDVLQVLEHRHSFRKHAGVFLIVRASHNSLIRTVGLTKFLMMSACCEGTWMLISMSTKTVAMRERASFTVREAITTSAPAAGYGGTQGEGS